MIIVFVEIFFRRSSPYKIFFLVLKNLDKSVQISNNKRVNFFLLYRSRHKPNMIKHLFKKKLTVELCKFNTWDLCIVKASAKLIGN